VLLLAERIKQNFYVMKFIFRSY